MEAMSIHLEIICDITKNKEFQSLLRLTQVPPSNAT